MLNTLWAARPRAHQRLAPIEVGIVLGDLLESTAHAGDLFTAGTESTRTRIPDPELEEIDRSLNRRLKPASPPPASTDDLA